MKQRTTILLLLLLVCQHFNAQTITEKYFDRGNQFLDEVTDIQPTTDKGYMMVGTIADSTKEDADVFLWKIDSSGNTVWFKRYGTDQDEIKSKLVKANDNTYLICGTVKNLSTGKRDIFLIKTNADGEKIWENTLDYGVYDGVIMAEWTLQTGFVIYIALEKLTMNARLYVDGHGVYFSIKLENPPLQFVPAANGEYYTLINSSDYYIYRNTVLVPSSYLTTIYKNNYLEPYLAASPDGNLFVCLQNKSSENSIQYLKRDGTILWETTTTAKPSHHAFALYNLPGGQTAVYYRNRFGEDKEPTREIQRIVFDANGNEIENFVFSLPLSSSKVFTHILPVNETSLICVGHNYVSPTYMEPQIYKVDFAGVNSAIKWTAPFIVPHQNFNTQFLSFSQAKNNHFWVATFEKHKTSQYFQATILHTDPEGIEICSNTLKDATPLKAIKATTDNSLWAVYVKEDSIYLAKYAPDCSQIFLTLIDVRFEGNTIDDIAEFPDGSILLYCKDELVSTDHWFYFISKDGNLTKVRRLGKENTILKKIIPRPDGRLLCIAELRNYNIFDFFYLDHTGDIEYVSTVTYMCGTTKTIDYLPTSDGGYLLSITCDTYDNLGLLIKVNNKLRHLWTKHVTIPPQSSLVEIPCQGYVHLTKHPLLPDQQEINNQYFKMQFFDLLGEEKALNSVKFTPDATLANQEIIPGGDFSFWFDRTRVHTNQLGFVKVQFPPAAPFALKCDRVNITPNPSLSPDLTISNPYLGPISIKVFDAQGVLVHAFESIKTAEPWQGRLDLPSLATGVYMVQIVAGEDVFTGKWLKRP